MKTLLEEEEKNSPEIREHEVVKGKVVLVNKSEAFIDIGYKQEIPVPKKELAYPEPDSAEDVVTVGDEIDVYIGSLGGENGGLLSKVKADRMAAWKDLEGVKGRGETVEALPIEIDVRKQRLVLSRRQLLEAEREKKQEEVFATLEAGQTVHGTVKRLVDYGAFIDIGGVDGLAHISDLAWHRVSKPSDVLHVGQELDVYVKNVDKEAKRISLSVKDTMRDPWLDKAEKYAEGDHIEGKVIKLTDFGAFMEIEPHFDGLIPMGELADHRIERADEAVHVGDIVKVKVLRIDMKRKRISLSITKAKRDGDNAIYKRYLEEQDDAPTTIGDEVQD